MDTDIHHIIGHVASGVALLGALIGIVPAVAAVVAFVWYAVQIYESKTFQDYLKRRREKYVVLQQKRIIRMQRALDEYQGKTPTNG